jgi:6-phosphogluconolactonase
MPDVEILPDADSLARAAAARFLKLAMANIQMNAQFNVALSGGSTPQRMYRLLASAEFGRELDWHRVHLFWGDERCVPPGHAESNYRAVCEVLLDHIAIPAENVHRIRGEITPWDAADEYEEALKSYLGQSVAAGKAIPTLDLMLLGMGEDGHTASLFPHTAALDERERLVVAAYLEKPNKWRVTLTAPVINAAADVIFLVSGANKAEPLRLVLEGPHQPRDLPAQVVSPHPGRLHWMVDADAASLLPRRR